jgi:hypothetical protein
VITGRRYLLRGEQVTVLIAWNAARSPDQARLDALHPLVRTGRTAPRNVMIRLPDGTVTVRPFRGLRRIHLRPRSRTLCASRRSSPRPD